RPEFFIYPHDRRDLLDPEEPADEEDPYRSLAAKAVDEDVVALAGIKIFSVDAAGPYHHPPALYAHRGEVLENGSGRHVYDFAVVVIKAENDRHQILEEFQEWEIFEVIIDIHGKVGMVRAGHRDAVLLRVPQRVAAEK